MITGPIKSQIDQIWNAFWSGGISNPLEVIEAADGAARASERQRQDQQGTAAVSTTRGFDKIWKADRMLSALHSRRSQR